MKLKYVLIAPEQSISIEQMQRTRDRQPEELRTHYDAIIVHTMQEAIADAIRWRKEEIARLQEEMTRLLKGEIKNYPEEKEE